LDSPRGPVGHFDKDSLYTKAAKARAHLRGGDNPAEYLGWAPRVLIDAVPKGVLAQVVARAIELKRQEWLSGQVLEVPTPPPAPPPQSSPAPVRRPSPIDMPRHRPTPAAVPPSTNGTTPKPEAAPAGLPIIAPVVEKAVQTALSELTIRMGIGYTHTRPGIKRAASRALQKTALPPEWVNTLPLDETIAAWQKVLALAVTGPATRAIRQRWR